MDELASAFEALRNEPAPGDDEAHRARLLEAVGSLQRRSRAILIGGYGALGAVFLFALCVGLQSLTDSSGPSARADTTPGAAPGSTGEHVSKAHPLAPTNDRASVGWRSLYQSGDYDGAAQRLLAAGTEVGNDPAALMDAADVACLSNHPEASVGYLSRVLREYAQSPVAPLAGFTLGRVLLERLGRPSDAAEAFALARSSARGSLAQDALAREVEAWSKAGRSHEAYEQAQLYVRLYPSGWRLRAVRLYGGLK
jgi:transmembrane sensor